MTQSELLTPAENAALAVDLDPVRLQRETAAWRAGNRLWRAVMLAPTAELCDALLRGQHVPLERLDPAWVAKFGLRS